MARPRTVMPRTRRSTFVPVVATGIAAMTTVACGHARPYRAMAKAAASEASVVAQAEDRSLKMHLRETIAASDARTLVDVTPYAYMGHAYLVGFVADPRDADDLVARVRAIPDVRSVDAYLPTKPRDRSVAGDVEVKSKLKAALAADPRQAVTRVEIEVLAGHVVLLGVVASSDAVADAGRLASGVGGVTGVTNFLLVAE